MIELAFVFGLLGNIISFMVYLAPMPTFYQIYKKKSTEGFQSIPYVIGLLSAALWIYYAFLKTDTTLLITINSVGCFIETYICFFIFYTAKAARMQTVKLILLLNVLGFGLVVALTYFLPKGAKRGEVVGWICLIFNLCTFAAPSGILRQVIRTRSVEYMPFLLSFFLTLCAITWFFYGLLRKDYNIAIPNVLGFSFGVLQMVLYVIYKNAKKNVIGEKLPEIKDEVSTLEDHELLEVNDQTIDCQVECNGVFGNYPSSGPSFQQEYCLKYAGN